MHLNIFDRPAGLAFNSQYCYLGIVTVDGHLREVGRPVKEGVIRLEETAVRHDFCGADVPRQPTCSGPRHRHDLRHIPVLE